MVKIKLKGTAGRQNTPDWYRHDTEELAGVTNLPANKELGLENVLIFPPSDAQADNGMVCATIMKTVVGDIRATIYESKNSPGTVYLRPPQSREEIEETGEVKWHDEVKFPSKLIAQVLRYVETQVDFVDEETGEMKDGAGIGIGAGVGLGGANPFNVAPPTGDGGKEENPFANQA